MDSTSLALLIHELRNQFNYSEANFRIFNQALEQKASIAFFTAAQSVLLSASQASAIIWPTRARAKARGEAVRQVLQLPEKHALNDKRLVGLWEHPDEKLDDWITATKGKQIVFDHLGRLSDFDSSQVPVENVFRLYDPETMIFYYRGTGFKVQAIADALAEIYPRLNAVHRQFFPDYHQPSPSDAAPPPAEDAPAASAPPASADEAEEVPAAPKKKAGAKKGAKKPKAKPAKK